MTLPRSVARRWTRIAQGAALVALALALAVILTPRDTVSAPDPVPGAPSADTSAPAVAPTDTSASAGVAVFDWPSLADVLAAARGPMAASNEPVTAEMPSPVEPEDEQASEVAAGPAPPGWQYVGFVRDANGVYTALVTLNGKQKFLRAGNRHAEFLVSSVTADRLILERDDRRFEVTRVPPLAFDAGRAAMNAQNRLRNPARSRAAQLEQEQMRALEEARRRAPLEQGGSVPAMPPPNQ